jgi:hypothetical protein
MTRYYFDIRDGEALYADEDGLELEDQRQAEIEAATSLAEWRRISLRLMNDITWLSRFAQMPDRHFKRHSSTSPLHPNLSKLPVQPERDP